MTVADRIRAEALAALSAAADAALLDPSTAPASATTPAPTWGDLTQAAHTARVLRAIDEMAEQHAKITNQLG